MMPRMPPPSMERIRIMPPSLRIALSDPGPTGQFA
jgi:hypothetical protein